MLYLARDKLPVFCNKLPCFLRINKNILLLYKSRMFLFQKDRLLYVSGLVFAEDFS
jgi:hypothetical protein